MARAVAAGIVVVYFGALVALGGHDSWGKLGVPAASPTFLDLHSVTSGWECTRRGIPVLAVNPCDPLQRPANYPRVWMSVSWLGLGQNDTVYLGIALGVIFLTTALALCPAGSGWFDGVLYAGVLCSPAVMLGVERGNADLLVFVVVVLAILAIRRRRGAELAANGFLLAAAVLKLFPVFAFAAALRRPRRRELLVAVCALALFAVYAYSIRGDIATIRRVVPQARQYAYGLDISGWWLGRHLPGSRHAWDAVLVLAGLAVAVGVGLSFRSRRTTQEHGSALYGCWVGAAIYIGTFVAGNNFAYRLAFLLLTLPQLLQWRNQGRPLATVGLAALAATVWLIHGRALGVGAPAQLVLWALLGAALVGSLGWSRVRSARGGRYGSEVQPPVAPL